MTIYVSSDDSETLLKGYALLDVTFNDISDGGIYSCAVNNSVGFDHSDSSSFIVQGVRTNHNNEH